MSIKEGLSNFFFGYAGGLRKKDLDVSRYKFSDLLPYVSYDEEREFYYMKDNSIGWVYECTPLIFAGNAMSRLASIFKVPLPEKSVIQTVLYADPYIEDMLDKYKELRYSNPNLNEIYRAQTESFCKFFRDGAKEGLWQLSKAPIRMFRLYISIKVPMSIKPEAGETFIKEAKRMKDLVNDIAQSLFGASLNPTPVKPDALLFLLSRIFNPDVEPKPIRWDKTIPLNKQIINGGTLIKREQNSMKIGSLHARCLTPKQIPEEIDSSFMNNMIGYFAKSADSLNDDANQIRCPFIMTSIFIYENLGAYLDFRANQVNIQRASGNMAHGIVMRRNEMSWIKTMREKDGEVFVRVLNQLWLFGHDEDKLSDDINRVAAMWTNLNCVSQKELSFIMPKLFVSALPLGLYGNDYKDLERDLIMSSNGAAHMLAIQAGCMGLGKPYMLFADRRAQIVTLDILYTGANKNFVLTGGTGGGKSFFLNYLINSYLSTGARVRVIDVGESYKKMAEMFNGQFVKFAGSDVIINFFESAGDIDEPVLQKGLSEEEEKIIKSKQEDYADKMAMLTGIIATMCAKSSTPASDMQLTLIETAIRTLFKKYRGNTTIDMVADWLKNISIDDIRDEHLAKEGRYLAMALQKYCSDGEYGRYFNGKSNVNITGNLVVIELDGTPEDLRRTTVLAFANKIEDEIYNGDRKTPSIVVLDEAWQTLSENPAAGRFAEGLYRKIRKYNGGVGMATQSVFDLAPNGKLGALGVTIQTQSNMQILLPDKAFFAENRNSLVTFGEFEWHFLADKLPAKSLPKYSEFIVKSDKFTAAARLVTDEYTYFVCSSDATDNIYLNYYKDQFMRENPALKPMEAMAQAINKAAEVCIELGGVGGFKHYVNTVFIPQNIKKEKN